MMYLIECLNYLPNILNVSILEILNSRQTQNWGSLWGCRGEPFVCPHKDDNGTS